MIHSVTFTETQRKSIVTIRTIKVQNVAKSTRRMIQTKLNIIFLIRNADVLVIQKQDFQHFLGPVYVEEGDPR